MNKCFSCGQLFASNFTACPECGADPEKAYKIGYEKRFEKSNFTKKNEKSIIEGETRRKPEENLRENQKETMTTTNTTTNTTPIPSRNSDNNKDTTPPKDTSPNTTPNPPTSTLNIPNDVEIKQGISFFVFSDLSDFIFYPKKGDRLNITSIRGRVFRSPDNQAKDYISFTQSGLEQFLKQLNLKLQKSERKFIICWRKNKFHHDFASVTENTFKENISLPDEKIEAKWLTLKWSNFQGWD